VVLSLPSPFSSYFLIDSPPRRSLFGDYCALNSQLPVSFILLTTARTLEPCGVGPGRQPIPRDGVRLGARRQWEKLYGHSDENDCLHRHVSTVSHRYVAMILFLHGYYETDSCTIIATALTLAAITIPKWVSYHSNKVRMSGVCERATVGWMRVGVTISVPLNCRLLPECNRWQCRGGGGAIADHES
jgi:hypothetical protein